MESVPRVPEVPNTMPSDWEFSCEAIRMTLAPLDDLSVPYDRRSATFPLPRRLEDRKTYAESLGKMVERTILSILKIEEDSEQS